MLLEQFTAAADGARSFARLDEISRLTWRALAEGHLSDADAHCVSLAVEGRRGKLKDVRSGTPLSASKPLSRPRRPVSPDKAKSIARRRRWAASGALPPQIAADFTAGEVAALSVVAREIQRKGRCELPIDAVAALAGVSRTTTQNALRRARRLGLLSVTERRRRGRKSDTNIVVLVSREWRSWLRLHSVQKNEGHEYSSNNSLWAKSPQACQVMTFQGVRDTFSARSEDVHERQHRNVGFEHC